MSLVTVAAVVTPRTKMRGQRRSQLLLLQEERLDKATGPRRDEGELKEESNGTERREESERNERGDIPRFYSPCAEFFANWPREQD